MSIGTILLIAISAARSVPGVKSVKNDMRLK